MNPLRAVRTLAEVVRYEHTVFALPFAYVGALLAAGGWPRGGVALWILGAMVGGRTAAMALNRLIDRAIDRLNPRTASRHLPRGLAHPRQVGWLAAASFALLGVSAWRLNAACVRWLPAVVAVLTFYSYTKRFTWACHLALGAAYFFVPFGGWLAVTGRVDPPAVVLGSAAGLWVAGFDILYATQDVEFDRSHGLHSLPARFGVPAALRAARLLHALTIALLWWAGELLRLGPWFAAGLVVVAALLYHEHALVAPGDLSRLDAAFFNVNGYLSLLLLAFTAAEVVL